MKKYMCLVLFSTLFALTAAGQGFHNPVLPGFYPDPSVCRVGNDYYLVNSSFQYFPGVPVHHSKDLIHWEAIGHCISRPSQTKLEKIGFWNGIYAPTIRYHKGTFYMITTNTSDKGNFYVTTGNPAAEWSDPIWIDQPGIDPDLFFDDNGRSYILSARRGGYIQLREIDIRTGKLISEPYDLWRGTGGRCLEAPHLYKKDNYYYLVTAEGGTEYGHKVMIARSRTIEGPYENNPDNPILTHINSMSNPIQGTGHADFIQAHDGSWWTVFLGFRPQSHTHHLTGRETYLAPVQWNENEWPVVNGNGTVALDMNSTTLPQVTVPQPPVRTDFENQKLGLEWNYLCTPYSKNYSLHERKGYLRLKATTKTINQFDSPTFVGRRQQHIKFCCTTALDFSHLKDGAETGITTYMTTNYHYDLSVTRRDTKPVLTLNYHLGRLQHQEKELPLNTTYVYLRVEGSKDVYTFSYSTDNKHFEKLDEMDTRFLSSETAGGFTGIYLGLFAQSKTDNQSYADLTGSNIYLWTDKSKY